MKNDLPKYHDTFIPILEVLSSDEVLHYRELSKRVRDNYYSYLPNEVLNQKLKSGGSLIFNRIGWGKSYLKEGGFVFYPERAMVQITKKGKEALHRGKLTLKDLKSDPGYIDRQVSKNKSKEGAITDADQQQFDNLTPQDLIEQGSNLIEKEVKTELLQKLKNIDPYYFEKVILILLNKMGYGEFIETPKSNDGGIDGILNQDLLGLEKIYIQAKRYSENRVREKDIRNFIGAMSGDTAKGVFVTTSSFDDSATKKARDAHHKIILIDGIKLAELMYTYGIGVQIKDTYEIKGIDEDFFEDI